MRFCFTLIKTEHKIEKKSLVFGLDMCVFKIFWTSAIVGVEGFSSFTTEDST